MEDVEGIDVLSLVDVDRVGQGLPNQERIETSATSSNMNGMDGVCIHEGNGFDHEEEDQEMEIILDDGDVESVDMFDELFQSRVCGVPVHEDSNGRGCAMEEQTKKLSKGIR